LNNNLAPTYQRLFGFYCVLWYKKSNTYSVVDNDFKYLLDTYLKCASFDAFKQKIATFDSSIDSSLIADNLQSYLEQCNSIQRSEIEFSSTFTPLKRKLSKTYSFNNKVFEIHYDCELVQKTIHPSIAHLETTGSKIANVVYDIYLDNDLLCLFKNEVLVKTVPKRDYHKIQGKFAMELLSFIYSKKESDWLGTFHGSTISDGKNSILFIGESGKGKSTLCALLTAKGFKLVADDVSPMLASDSQIYHNPSAISIKEGAFNLLSPLISDFNSYPDVLFNKTKGIIKYIPCNTPIETNYPCKAIIMVNYNKGSETKLELISIKDALETLIPESWLSPNPNHAKIFLDWLSETPVYKLTYSSTDDVTKEITNCFTKFNNH